MITINNDLEINIAIGKNRKDKTWKNINTTWSKFVNKVSKTQRTEETYQQYISAKKDYQDNKKDVGGYVGGYLNGGRRKTNSVMYRSLITLDMDFGEMAAWDNWKMLFGYASCCYSTHKHTKEKPRLRIVMPTNREVTKEEYEPIARWVAKQIGIELFDNTTYEVARLMYFPSTSKDGDFFFDFCDGDFIDADKILSTFIDWKDCSCWYYSDRESTKIKREIKKQQNPLEKEGFVGAFCRTYSIQEAIDIYLSDEYESTGKDNRYSYIKGSTSNGLVIYDDMFAYSNHQSDVCSGQLCNAFDLVRMHKFSDLDEEALDNTPPNKMPSYKAMLDLLRKDKKVLYTMAAEDFEKAAIDDKNEELLELKDEEKGWLENLKKDKKGSVEVTIDNALLIMRNDITLKKKLRFNVFKYIREVAGQLSWRDKEDFTEWKDSDESNLRNYLEKYYHISSKNVIEDALNIIFDENKYNPVKNYLDNLGQWDGIERIKDILPDFFGVERNDYNYNAFKKSLVACVARIYKPGIKFDYVLTLVGKEGKGKSTLFRRLGGEWFSDNFLNVSGKEAKEQLQGIWIMEMSELAGLKKAEIEQIKTYISCQEDIYRPAYGHNQVHFKRMCVFFGTTNNNEFLRGDTGNRRFWPIQIDGEKATKKVFKDFTKELRDSIWAEAKYYYEQGEELWLGEELEVKAREEQDNHREIDAFENTIINYLNIKWPNNWRNMSIYDRREYCNMPNDKDAITPKGEILRDKFTVDIIWQEALGGSIDRLDKKVSDRIKSVMRSDPNFEEKIIKDENNKSVRGFIRKGHKDERKIESNINEAELYFVDDDAF